MSIFVFLEHSNNKIKKASLQALSLAQSINKELNKDFFVAYLGEKNEELIKSLDNFNLKEIIFLNKIKVDSIDNLLLTETLSKLSEKIKPEIIIFSNTILSKSVAPSLSILLNASIVSGITQIVSSSLTDFTVKKPVFAGKAFSFIKLKQDTKIITLNSNSFPIEYLETSQSHNSSTFEIEASSSKIKVLGQEKITGQVPLPEADIVVSGGRGLKGPENWKMIEELAQVIGAATACSRPVSDSDWRPHHEHVGQTGLTIRPSLYIAIGISGAIQHLAGVNSSKKIVVINKDSEAPFFKAADYGIVGDAFEVVPKLIEEFKKFKSA